MAKNLIIVESPNKIHTISEFVGQDYEIIATIGHIRELNKINGYNKETFEPNWSTVIDKNGKSKEPLIKDIKKAANEADIVYLATDPDREGEAISWHVWDVLNKKDQAKCRRITFNEITKSAVLNAIKNYREIDMNLVDSQFARRIIDRMIGYDLSSLIKQKLKETSAGRVQSVALLFLVDRQIERNNFVKSFWWEIDSFLKFQNQELFLKKIPYQVEEYKNESKSNGNFRFALKQDAEIALSKLGKSFQVSNISDPKLSKLDNYKAITTDKMLQLASLHLNWKPRKTTIIAQELFEGVEIDGKYQALISYPRTDSERLSDEFIESAKNFIISSYGPNYVTSNDKLDKTQKNKTNVQDAHEAIRPIDISNTPEQLKSKISKDCYELYNLIWTRTMVILMAQPLINNYIITLINNDFIFETFHKQLIFDGYYALPYYEKVKNDFSREKPKFVINEIYDAKSIEISEHEKAPPPYYTEASLIVALKDAGVGRPSTYAQMASIGVERGYVNVENRSLIPNDNGMLVIESLRKAFPDIITPKFTANMETHLDKIANGEEQWKEYLSVFAPSFKSEIKNAKETMQKIPDEPTGTFCPLCGKELLYKISRFRKKFIGCSGFPICKYIEPIEEVESINENCPECNKPLLVRKNKRGQKFIGCSGFPQCHFIKKYDVKK